MSVLNSTSSGEDIAATGIPRRLVQAFRRAELTGLKQAAIARAIALTIILFWLFALLRGAAWFYVPAFVVFAAIPAVHYALARGPYSRAWHGYLFFALDAALLTFTLLFPNPLLEQPWPEPVLFRFGNFLYFFVLLALVSLSYSPRLMIWAGLISVSCWAVATRFVAELPGTTTQIPPLSDPVARLERFLDPQYLSLNLRIQEAVVLLLVASILALSVSRSRQLAIRVVTAARERTNLARYFPPNIVDQLAEADNPFRTVRTQSVAVLFADMVGFTHMAEQVSPQEIVELLRAYHRRTERIVFENNGTLDKYLGDGVMATFGTPVESVDDAGNALACARELIAEIADWNKLRQASGFPTVRLSIGVHYGAVVRGDIGTERRLEYAVLGDTVNVTSRLEELTRTLDCSIVASDALITQVRASGNPRNDALLDGFTKREPQRLRGREAYTEIWSYGAA